MVLAAILGGTVFFLLGSIFQVFSQAVFVLFFREIATPKEAEPVAEAIVLGEAEEASLPDPAAGN
jgi:hypothetical protein